MGDRHGRTRVVQVATANPCHLLYAIGTILLFVAAFAGLSPLLAAAAAILCAGAYSVARAREDRPGSRRRR